MRRATWPTSAGGGTDRRGQAALAGRYEALRRRGRGLRLIGLDPALARAATQLRATAAVRTPDTLQLAAGMATRCGTFVTDDHRLPPVPGLRVLEMAAYVPPA